MVLVFATGLALRLFTAWSKLEERPFSGVPDDTFYYFAIARNIARGHPPSIDGVSPTNGFHPLWMLVLVALFAMGKWPPGARFPLHFAFTLGALLDVGSAYLLFRLLASLRVHRSVILLIVAAFLLNPYQVELATWGLETPLALFLSLVFAWVACRAPRGTRLGSPAVFGATGALMMLARTDHVVVFAVAWLLRARRVAKGRRRPFLVKSGAVAAVLSLPWPLYSLWTTGTIIQSSSLAIALVNERLPAAWGLDHQTLALRAERTLGPLFDAIHLTATFTGLGGAGTAAFAASCLAICSAIPKTQRTALAARLGLLLPWGAGLVVLFVLHCFARKVYREWYTAPFVVFGLSVVAVCFDATRSVSSGTRRLGFLAAAATVAGSLFIAWRVEGVFERADYRGWEGGAGRREGQTDCGASSYFLEARTTNLDGVVNQAALSALRAGRLIDYIAAGRFDRVTITPQLHSPVFLGARYRERLRGIPGDDYGGQVVTALEKDAVISLGEEPLLLGSASGRELLSDGWDWPMNGRGLVSSVGRTSELVFVPADGVARDRSIEVELESLPEAGERQRVTVFLNGTRIGRVHVGSTLAWYRMGAASIVSGRNRLRFEYDDARPVRVRPGREWWSGWNWLYGYPVRAVRAGSIALLYTSVPLPPEGPALAEPKSDALFRSGFLPVERTPASSSVWAVGDTAVVEFSSSLPPSPRTLTLILGPPPPLGNDGGQHVEVRLNEQQLPSIDLVPGTVSRQSLPVPQGLLAPTRNRLELHFARRSPADAANVSRTAYFGGISLE